MTGDLEREEDLSAILAGAGSPDILVLNAGTAHDRLFVTGNPEALRETGMEFFSA